MRPRTGAALVAVLVVLGGVVLLGAVGDGSGATVSERWISDTGTDIGGNHHAPAVGTVDGQPMVFAPISGEGDTDQCRLAALDGEGGGTRWTHGLSPADCQLHAVADPTLADFDDDGTTEVLVATTEEAVTAFHPTTGEPEFRHELTSYGYTQPIVADLTGDGRREVVVVDVRGSVFVLDRNGTERWTRQLDSYTWAQPAVEDFDGDGDAELFVALRDGSARVFEANGSTRWNRTAFDAPVSWTTTVERGGGTDPVVATIGGTVARLDGADGSVRWERDFGEYAAVNAVGDGDGDGETEVYAVARDGTLRSVTAADGTVEWTTTLTTADVQMMPPPSMGDVDGDGEPELVAATNDGIVSVVDPATGDVLDSYERDVAVFTHPTIADGDGDGDPEAYVVYGDGRVVALSVSGD